MISLVATACAASGPDIVPIPIDHAGFAGRLARLCELGKGATVEGACPTGPLTSLTTDGDVSADVEGSEGSEENEKEDGGKDDAGKDDAGKDDAAVPEDAATLEGAPAPSRPTTVDRDDANAPRIGGGTAVFRAPALTRRYHVATSLDIARPWYRPSRP